MASLWVGAITPVLAAVQYSIIDLGDLGGGYSDARAINELGQVAGVALMPVDEDIQRAALWQAGMLTDLGTLGGLQSRAFAINSSGTVGGLAQDAAGNALPTLWSGETATAMPTLGGKSGTVWGLNDAGEAVGHSYLATGVPHATLWTAGGARDLGTLGGSLSVAYDINNQGTIVGSAFAPSGPERAVIWSGGATLDISGLSGGTWIAARAVNDSGQIILWGKPLDGTSYRATFWDGNHASPVIELGTFGGAESWAYGLNSQGFVVGEAENADGYSHAFVWDGAEKVDLGTLGGFSSKAYGINDQGVIVGAAKDALGATHAVAWAPVPEPSVLWLGFLGAALLGWRHCRKGSPISTRLAPLSIL